VASVVTALHLQPGQAVAADQPVASLTPVGARWQAWLMAPASSLGGLAVGQPVALRLASFPFQQHGLQRGRVLTISRAPMSPGERAVWVGPGATRSGSEPMYRVTVALDAQTLTVAGQPRELTAGMPLQADVVLERRRLLDRLLDPLRPTWQRLSE
jgi:membrane fusion protein